MVSAAASKKGPTACFFRELLAAPSAPGKKTVAAPEPSLASLLAARRLLGTGAAPFRSGSDDDDDSEGSSDDDATARGFSFPVFFSTGPFGEPTKLSRLLALMEDGAAPSAAAKTTGSGAVGGLSSSASGWSVAKEDDDAVVLRVPMPGLGKEHVKVWAEQNVVMVKGERVKGAEDDDDDAEGPASYTRRIELAADAFKMDQIKAEMKNGVLKVTVPKLKHAERKDVFQVTVE